MIYYNLNIASIELLFRSEKFDPLIVLQNIPPNLEPLDEDARHEHAGEDEAHVHRSGGPGPQVLDCVDGALQLAHGLEGSEQEQEGEGDEENILVNRTLLCFSLLYRHILIETRWKYIQK